MKEINIKSSTIEKSLDLAKDFLQKLIGAPVDELGLLFADNVKLWRLKNQLRNLEKVKKLVEEKNISIKQIHLKVLVPYLDGVSLEDDETLQDLWANMFTNFIDSKKNLTITVYPSILKQLSTNEVKILTFMHTEVGGTIITSGTKKNKEINFNSEEMANLERLGLIRQNGKFSQHGGDIDYGTGQWRWDIEEIATDEYYITDFGQEFLNACGK